ncbi:glycosyl transferase, partial [Marinobacter sp. Z-F4-2]
MARKQAKKNQSKKNGQVTPTSQSLARMTTAFDKAYKASQLTQALNIAGAMTQQFPSSALGWVAKADTYARLKQFADAISCMQQIDKIMHQVPSEYQLKRAQYQVLGGQASDAIPTLLSLVKQQDKNPDIFSWLSQAYHVQGKNDLALQANDKAIQLDRSNVDTLLWRSRILDNLRRPGEAKKTLLEVKKLASNKLSVNNHLGSLAMREGEYREAEQYFQAELSLQDNSQVFSNLIIAQHYNPENTAEQLKEIHQQWAKKYQLKNMNGAFKPARPNKKIRLGLLSGGFRVHPVGQMVLPALENLSSDEFELFFYSTNQVQDSITEKVIALASQWRVVENVTNQYLSDVIKSDGIDILLDMNGGGDGSRYQAISSKPAPLIVKWVGMQINTTGLDAVDYFLSDHFETPHGSDHLYTEKLIRLPDDYVCYHLPEYMPSVSSLPALGNQFITFGCLNNPAKLSPPLIKEWAQLLHEVPSSRLLLRGIQFEGDNFKRKIVKSFNEQGIEEGRLILEGPARHEQFLTTYQRIDIALDTWPYSGGLTTCEALAMGVPVVTCVGPTFAGRHSATHLANAGMPELVTDNWDDFRKRAKELASDLPSLAVIRAALPTILKESPLCDGPRFAKHFTMAMRGIWYRHCEGKQPEALTFNKEGDAWFADDEQLIELVAVESEPEQQEAELEWHLDSPITVIDNGALFARHPRFTEWMQTGNFAVITFDPGSLLTKQADELKQLGEWHHYPHATLGDGKDATLYATLDPELTGTLQPLEEQQTGEQDDPLRVLSMLPISTVPLNAIEGLPGIDLLILDSLNDAIAILENGHRYLANTLLVQVKLAFQPTHERQPNLAELQRWASLNGLDFLRLENLTYKGLELRSDDAIFVAKDIDSQQKDKVEWLLAYLYE